jgi:alkylated DNA repair dioxygenase AlkB
MALTPSGKQLDFPELAAPAHVRLDLPEADIVLYRQFYSPAEADESFAALMKEAIPWKQDELVMFDKRIPVPRLASWHGDPGCSYTYSGIRSEPNPWIPALLKIRESIERHCAQTFNSVLVNQYRDGMDSVSWHSDDEPELGHQPTIASLSLGETRLFQLKHKRFSARRTEFDLTHGSLLIMRGPTQHQWLHQIPKTKKGCGIRLNLTFRTIQSMG